MSEPLPEVIAISKIDLDGSPHVRVMENDDLIADYAERRKNCALLPPIDVFWDVQHSVYLVADGRHRVLAEKANQEDGILAIVHEGGARECLQFALSANSRHGLRRTQADIRLVVETALKDAEWGECSNRLLAGLCNVSEITIRRHRKALEPDITEIPAETDQTDSGATGVAPAGTNVKPARKRKGADGREYPAESSKPEAAKPDAKSPTKADRGGHESVSPEQRKEVRETFGKLVRLLGKLPEWKAEVEPELAAIADKLKKRWGRGGK